MKVIVRPFSLKDNEYIKLIKESLVKAGIEPVPRKGNVFSADYIILNWFENIDSSHPMFEYIKKRAILAFLRLRHVGIVFVLHNKEQHDKSGKYGEKLFKALLMFSDRIMVLCDESYKVIEHYSSNIDKRKIRKVVHPNYCSVYPTACEKKTSYELTFLFVGVIRPYKNVEYIIDNFKSIECKNKKKLIIAGNCTDQRYRDQLLELIDNDPEIETYFRYIKNDEMGDLISKSDVVVLPYGKESILNSGTIMLAFSNRRTVISPLIGTLLEYEHSDEEFFYSYDYSTQENHKEQLLLTMQKVADDYSKDNNILVRKGNYAYNYVVKNNSLDVLAEQFKRLFA